MTALVSADPVPPPLTDEQLTRVRNLVKTHQEERADLKARLEAAQQKLAGSRTLDHGHLSRKRRFAAARFSDDRKRFAFAHAE